MARISKSKTTNHSDIVQAPLPDEIQNNGVEANPLDASQITRAGKDELNLIEHPWITLWKQESKEAIIEHNWEARHPITKKAIKAVWRVEGSPQLGLPTASDLRVYLVLMELTRDQGFEQVVAFSRYELVKRLGWPLNQQSYTMLMNAFRRLAGVTISAQNAFWDSKLKSFRDVVFSIIDNVEIFGQKGGRRTKKPQEGSLPLSSFRWNDVIFQSFKTGYLRTFDLGFALSLKGDISLSLYRYLGKKAYDGRSGFEIELETLYNRHLGLRNTQYASKMKERLKPAHDELVGRGFLESVSYSPMKSKKGEKVCYAFTRSVPAFAPEEEKIESAFDAPLPRKRDEEEPGDSEKMREEAAASGVIFELPPLLQQMLEIGLSANVAEVFFETMPHEVLSEQLDCLADRHPLNPAATFVSAVRGGWAPPSAYLARCEAQKELASNEQRNKKKHQQMVVAQQLKAENDRQEQQEMAALDKAFGEMPDGDREEIEGEVARRMQFVLDHLGREAAVNGWQATRRQILREWVEEGRDVTRGSHQSEQGSAGSANTLLQRELFWNDEEIVPSGQAHSLQPAASSDTQLDNTYIKLSLTQQQEIDAAVDKRLEEAGMLTMTKEHPGWLGVRRTVMRQSLSKRKPAG